MADDHGVDDLLDQLKHLGDDRSRLRVLKAWASEPDHVLSCEQMTACLKRLFGLGDVAVKGAVILYPKLSDPENFLGQVLPVAFEFDDERADVKQALGL